MKYAFTLNAANPKLEMHTPFGADYMTVQNPSPNVVLIRLGGTDYPSTPDGADLVVYPYTIQGFPVEGNTFAAVITSIGLAAPSFNSAFPQSVNVVFTAGEVPPNFGAMPIGNIGSAALPMGTSPIRIGGTYTDTWVVPPGVRAIGFANIGRFVTDITASGAQTGRVYWRLLNFQNTDNAKEDIIVFTVEPELDSQLTINLTTAAGPSSIYNTYSLIAYQSRMPVQRNRPDGRLTVDPYPPGEYYLRVNLRTATNADVGTANSPLFTKEVGNESVRTQLLPLAARGGTTLASIFQTYPYTRINLYLRITGYPGGGAGLAFRVESRDSASGATAMMYNGAAGDAANTAGSWVAQFGPGLPTAARVFNMMCQRPMNLPYEVVVYVNHLDALSYTYELYLERIV